MKIRSENSNCKTLTIDDAVSMFMNSGVSANAYIKIEVVDVAIFYKLIVLLVTDGLSFAELTTSRNLFRQKQMALGKRYLAQGQVLPPSFFRKRFNHTIVCHLTAERWFEWNETTYPGRIDYWSLEA